MNKILLSTTNTLEGWEITEYLGTISSNAVIGANVLSDIAASWTDFFGGRSGSYEKRLQQIYKEALSALENKASDVGANCVVGLHIDIDEISGKGSQMFMITSYGTAVRATRIHKERKSDPTNNTISGTSVNNRVQMLKIRKLAESGEPVVPYLDEVIENEAFDLSEYIFRDVRQSLTPNPTTGEAPAKNHKNEAFRFAAGMPREKAIDILYRQILKEPNSKVISLIGQISRKLLLINYARIPDLIKSGHKPVIIEAMRLLKVPKPFYVPEDKKYIEDLLSIIDAHILPIESKVKKNLLSSKEKETWRCKCGASNDVEKDYCTCSRDRYGYLSEQFWVKDVKEHLGFVLSSLDNQQREASKATVNG